MTEPHQSRLNDFLASTLQDIPSLELKTAMHYALHNGGKRLRPALIYTAGQLFGAPLDNLDAPAAAVELIHTYSLIHDDLPCMDNADLRRGKPTCHKMFTEGMAVLVGDALHTLAIQLLSDHPALTPVQRLQMISVLTQACGPFGMAGGQALDITVMQDNPLSCDLLETIYRLKTGALFTACLKLGHIASSDRNEINQKALARFGDCIGLAFQIQDDILDIESTTQQLGKEQGIDNKNKKITYPSVAGLLAAKEKVQTLYLSALQAINYLGSKAQPLRDLTARMLQRSS